MGPYMEGLDDIRKTKIKEYFDSAQVRAKDKPKPVAPPPKAAPPPQKRTVTKKAAPGLKAPIKRVSSPIEKATAPSPQPKPAAGKAIPSKLGGLSKPGLAAPSGLKKKLPGAGPAPTLQSPRRNISSPSPYDEPPAPKLGRGLAGRPLGKPITTPSHPQPLPPSAPPGMTAAEREELEELRSDKDRLLRSTDELRSEKAKLQSQIHELQNQNAQLIEDHTRDVLSIKAKETQLVRARSDAEAAESLVQRQGREMERLKRELARNVREQSPIQSDDQIYQDRSLNGTFHRPGTESFEGGRSESRDVGYQRARGYMGSPSEEKENGSLDSVGIKKPTLSRDVSSGSMGGARPGGEEAVANGENGKGVDSYKRAAEVTSQLKARIEMMKASQPLHLM